jgi:hypothetical protein
LWAGKSESRVEIEVELEVELQYIVDLSVEGSANRDYRNLNYLIRTIVIEMKASDFN